MSVPDLKHIVDGVRARGWDFSAKEGLCAYGNAVVEALHAADANFGHLVKIAAQNHCTDSLGRRHAVDVALYRPTGQVVDFIASAGFGPDVTNDVTWGVGHEGEYPESSWFAPGGEPVTPPSAGQPQTPSVDTGPILARLAALEAEMATKAASSRVEDINKALNLLEDTAVKVLPEYVGEAGPVRLWGINLGSFTVISRPKP